MLLYFSCKSSFGYEKFPGLGGWAILCRSFSLHGFVLKYCLKGGSRQSGQSVSQSLSSEKV